MSGFGLAWGLTAIPFPLLLPFRMRMANLGHPHSHHCVLEAWNLPGFRDLQQERNFFLWTNHTSSHTIADLEDTEVRLWTSGFRVDAGRVKTLGDVEKE